MKKFYLLFVVILLSISGFGQATVPFTEGFENTTFPPTGWTSFRGTNGQGTLYDWVRSTESPRTGSASAFVRYENVANNAQDWLVTPAINLANTTSNNLSFYAKDAFGTSYGSIYTVRVSTTSQTNIASFTTLATYTETQLGNNSGYKLFNVSLAGYTGIVYIAFVMQNDDGDSFFLDDVSVTGNPTGPTTVNCGSGLNDGFCYANSQTITRSYAASVATNQLRITFTAGTLEANGTGTYDDLIIYDGTNASGPVLYNSDLNGNTINGRTFLATSGKIFLSLVSDTSVSCANGDQTALAYTLTCVTPCTTTPINVTALTATPASQQVALNWTNSTCFDEVLVVAKANTAVTASPTGNGSAYTANAAFTGGTQIAPGEYVVYKGTGATVNVTGLTNGTTYHFRVYTRKGSNWSTGVAVNATPALTYCDSAATNTVDEWISRVQLNTINNPSGSTTYSNFTAISTTLAKGSQYTITVTPAWGGITYSEAYAVYIDYNNNGDFTDAGEQVFTQAATTASPVSGSFTIPVSSVTGSTRMRVVMDGGIAGPSPCGTYTFGETEDYTINIVAPITYVFNNGWSPSDPNGQATSLNNIIVASGAATINSNISAGNVTVASTGALTVASGNTFNVTNNLNLQSNSVNYSSLIVNGTLTGTVNYTRHVNSGAVAGVGGNDLISAPLSGQAFSAFKLANGNIRTNPAGTLNLFGPFQKPVGNPGVFLTYANTESAVLAPGEGYRAASTDNGGFTFTGTLNTGTVNRTIENVGSTFSQWNLIGNPYPSYLYVKEQVGAGAHPGFLNANIGQFAPNYVAIYGYDNDTSDGNNYTIWNLANTTGSTVITPGQGFFVASGTGGGSVNFTPGMRAIGSTDDFISGRQGSDENNASLRLNLTNGSDNFVTDFYFNDASTLGLDPGYDAGLFGGSTPSFSIFSQLVEDNAGVNMAIQSLPFSSLGSEVVIPVGLRVTQGQQVTISIANTTLPSGVEVYLEDTAANTSTLLNTSDYVFTTDSNLNGVGRFNIRFTNTTLSTPESNLNGLQIYTTATPRSLFIKGQLATATTLSLYDVQGRIVLSSVLDTTSNSNQVDVSNLSSGVYVVKLNNSAQQKTQKVILK